MRKKRVITIVLLIMAIVVFGSCSKRGQSINDGRLIVAHWDVNVGGQGDNIVALVNAFKVKHPGIDVEIIDIPSTDYTQKLQIMLNGGSDVDVFWIKDGDTTKGLVNRGQLADLTAYAKQDNIDLSDFSGLAERFVIDGKLVALPASTSYYVLFYNKDIFDNAGIPYPSNNMTWTEWEKLAEQLSSGSGVNRIYGGLLHTWPALVQNWGVQSGRFTIMDYEAGYSFFKPYYEMALRMQDNQSIWDYGALRSAGIHYSSLFLQGYIATMPMGTWFYANMIERINSGESNIRWGIATLPRPAGVTQGWTVGSVTPIAMNQASNRKDTAWEFIKFITSEEGARIYASHGILPGRADENSLSVIASLSGMPEGALEALQVKNIALDRPMVDHVAEVNQMLGQEHGMIMLKEVSIERGLENMTRRSRQIQTAR